MSAHSRAGAFDLVTLGRVGVDLYPLQHATKLEDVAEFTRSVGGSPTNVAIAGARHGLRSAAITRTGEDPFGVFIRQELQRLGVDNRFVLPAAGAKTTLAFCEVFPPDHFPTFFYRDLVAPELTIATSDLDLKEIASARAFWSTATGLAGEASREAHHAAWESRGRDQHTILDLDYRAGFWPDQQTATAEIRRALAKVTIAIGNLQECEVAVGESDPMRAADALLASGVSIAVVKMGGRGAIAKSADAVVDMEPVPIRVVNGLGAGDGFGGAFVAGLLDGWPLDQLLRFAGAAGAIVASRLECSTAMPTTREVNDLLAHVARG